MTEYDILNVNIKDISNKIISAQFIYRVSLD